MPATTLLLQEGRYNIEQELPFSDSCSLFQAYDTKAEEPVTIVEVPLALPKVTTATQREAMAASFRETAQKLTGFSHKAVFAVRTYFTEAGRNYLVTDPVDGPDLASVLADQDKQFGVVEAAGWADTVLDALNVMHNQRPVLIHSRLSPVNLVLRPDGSIGVTAAGMMLPGKNERSANSRAAQSSIVYSPLEQIWSGLDAASQKVIISKYDEASERVLKQDLDPRSDLYSLGATLYHLLTGRAPADALERSIEMIDGLPDPLQSPNKENAAIPIEVSDVIMKAMEIKREYRFDSAAIMRQVLKTALVRVKEREAAEGVSPMPDAAPSVSPASTPPASVKAEDEERRKLRETEEKRLAAERQAAEAEKKLRETKAAQAVRVTETFTLADLEDDLLGLMSTETHTSEPPQKRTPIEVKTAVPKNVSALDTNVERPLPESKTKTEPVPSVVELTIETPSPVETAAVEIDDAPEVFASAAADEKAEAVDLKSSKKEEKPEPYVEPASPASSFADDTDIFASKPAGRSMSIPAIAAAAVVLCIAVIGGWFYLGASPAAAPAAVIQAPASSQPVQEAPAEVTSQPVASEFPSQSPSPEVEQVAATEQLTSTDQPQRTASTAVPAKQKKPVQAPAKAPAQKKAVTVDDLINDN